MIIYHASKEIVKYPEIRMAEYTKDFSWGFYCTNNYDQAVRWATRGTGKGIINKYEYNPNGELDAICFDEMDDEWLDFIALCRSGKTHSYDIAEGPMANDTVWNYVNDYIKGTIDREQFWVLAKFRYPTHQISFHTVQALECLHYIESEEVYDN